MHSWKELIICVLHLVCRVRHGIWMLSVIPCVSVHLSQYRRLISSGCHLRLREWAPCLRWSNRFSSVSLWSNSAFLIKVLSLQFMNQPIVLVALQADKTDIRVELCPVRSLRVYTNNTTAWIKIDQLFVWFSDMHRECFAFQTEAGTLGNSGNFSCVQICRAICTFIYPPSLYSCFGNILGSVQGSVTLWDWCCSNLKFILQILSFLQIKCDFLASGLFCSVISLYNCFARGFLRTV